MRKQFLTSDNLHLSRSNNGLSDQIKNLSGESAINCTTFNAGLAGYLSLDETVRDYVKESVSENTRKACKSDLRHFKNWGGLLPAPPETIAQYLADHADSLKISTLTRRLATLSKAHTANGWKNPCRSQLVHATLRGIKRIKGTLQVQAKPLLRDDLFLILDGMKDRPKDLRDRALILLGFAGGFRRSELIGLSRADIEEVREGIIIHLRRSKTDQTGQGRKLGIPRGRTRYCPVAALEAWLSVLTDNEGPVFRPIDRHGNIQAKQLGSDAVPTILRKRLEMAGIDCRGYSGHSLRAGFATSAAMAGVSSYKIRAQTGHASDVMLARYIRDGELFEGNAVAALL